MVKDLVRKIMPSSVILFYHYLIAHRLNILTGRPSRKMVVVGVTGTNGKTSVSFLIREILQNSGIKTGLLGTAQICIGDKVSANKMHMTMPGRGFIHKKLKEMLDAGCY